MLAHSLPFAPARTYQRLLWLALGVVLLPLLLVVLPPLVQREQVAPTAREQPVAPVAPAPVAPPNQTLPPGLGPVLNATLAANSAEDYAVTPLGVPADGLRADNPAQRFATTFGTQGVRVAPVNGPGFALRATAINTAHGNIVLAATPPISDGPRVEYRQDGMTEWYVNGPRGLEQGFTLATPPAGAEQFTLMLPVAGEALVQDGDAVMIGGLRYGGLSVLDATGATLPAHLDLADGTIRIAVDAAGAQWPVTVDPLVAQASLAPQTPLGNTTHAFGQSTAIAIANGTTTIVVGAPSELIGTQDEQGAVYVFTGSGGTYTQRARLTASDGVRQNRFGQSVAVTISGGTTTVAVGTFNVSKAYVYTSGGGAYAETLLVPPDPTNGDAFGDNVAAVTNGGATIIAVSAQGHAAVTNTGQGTVYLFSGSGTSFPLQFELNSPNPSAYGFGTSVALVSNGGTNTLAVGIYNNSRSPNGYSVGAVMVFTGSGTSYSAVTLTAADNQPTVISHFGSKVAVGVLNGVTTVVTSDPAYGDRRQDFGVYVFAGSGASYTQTKLIDASNAYYDNFGVSVAVGYSYSQTLVAVGASGKNSSTGNAADGVLIFSQTGASYAQSSLPQLNGFVGDHYGLSVAMQAVSNSDPVVVGGAPDPLGSSPGAATVSSWSAQASVRATFGDGSQLLVSPAASPYSGIPFHLVASVVDGNGNAIPPTRVTFIVKPSGGTGGLFTASDPTSTTLHVTTRDGSGGTTAGQTDTINLYPSSTAGSFTVTAAADGTALSATYTLTIIANVPTPTINAVIPVRTTSAVAHNSPSSVTESLPPGFSPPLVIIDPTKTYTIHISGSGFVKETYTDPTDPNARFRTYYEVGLNSQFLLDTVYVSSTELLVTVSGPQGMFAGLTTDANANIQVRNPSSSPGGPLGTLSAPRFLGLVMPRPAQGGSTLKCSGSLDILASSSNLFVPPPCQIVDAQGNPIPGIATGKATGVVGSSGGQLVGNSGGTIIAQGGGNIISQGGGNIIAQGGGNLITNDGGSIIAQGGGNIVANGAAKPASQSSPAQAPVARAGQSSVQPSTASSVNGDYIASTDAHSIIMAPPVLSNGIPGTFTRSLAVDGIATPITYTITTLNPHDGHPTTITALSHTAASTSDPAIPLTVTGTGFIAGSVISYGGVQLTTTYISPTQISATIPAALLNYTGAKDVVVINPDPNGGASLPATFTVTAPATAASVKPTLVSVGQSFTLTVTGSNFVNGATVRFNGTPLVTTFVSATTLTAQVPGTLDQTVGTAKITVVDPYGVGTSALTFTIAVVKPEPPPRPGVPPVPTVPGVKPLPAGRSLPASGPPPAPIPPSR